MTHAETAQGVREVIADALDLDVDQVQEEARLIEDLGGDSLDWLDIMFRLEERFYVALSPRAIEEEAKRNLGEEAVHVEGIYTPEAMDALRRMLPEVPPEELPDGMTLGELPRVFRVSTMIRLVAEALARPPEENERLAGSLGPVGSPAADARSAVE